MGPGISSFSREISPLRRLEGECLGRKSASVSFIVFFSYFAPDSECPLTRVLPYVQLDMSLKVVVSVF